MFDALLEQSLKGLDAVKRHIEWSDFIRSLLAKQQIVCGNASAPCFDVNAIYSIAPANSEWRIIDHCSAVTRLYAIYERFVHELLREFLAFLEQNVPYSKLDLTFRTEHQRSFRSASHST